MTNLAHPVVDSDAHVLECLETWDFLEPSAQKYRPVLVQDRGEDETNRWLIDGHAYSSRAYSTNQKNRKPLLVDPDAGTLRDVTRRLKQMDELGVDVQVIYPTLFLHRVTDKVEEEIALVRAYNRYLIDRCGESSGRLQWVMELPWISISDAVDELRFCAEKGACGIHAKGIEIGRDIADPYFYPVFEAAQELGIPVCIHAGEGDWKSQRRTPATPEPAFLQSKLPGISAFHTLGSGSVYADFPSLRFGFVELSASWIPYLAHDMRVRIERRASAQPAHLFDSWSVFVACENTDDLDHVLSYIGADHLVFGTDYGHVDTSSDLEGTSQFQANHDAALATLVLSENPRNLYAFSPLD